MYNNRYFLAILGNRKKIKELFKNDYLTYSQIISGLLIITLLY